MRKIKAIAYGVGKMGKLLSKYMVEKGVEIVGAIDANPEIVGKDLGEVVGLSYPLGVTISDDADTVLSEQKADIAVLALFTWMEAMYPYYKRCIEKGLNVISTSEEPLYPWTTSPELTSDLDKLAKAHGVTITAGGFQDTFWVNLVVLLTGVSHTIETVTGQQKYNVDEGGPMGAKKRHFGETKGEFYQKIREQGTPPSYTRMALEAVIAGLGLTIKKIQSSVRPTLDDVDIDSKALGRIIKKGEVTGMVEITEIETEQGIKFQTELIAKAYREREVDINRWSIKGVPNLSIEHNDRVETLREASTQIVNRIPDVINAEPGYITVEKLPLLKFRAFPLDYYLKK